MVLRVVFFAFSILILFSINSYANPTLACIGKGNSSSSDKFYANKLNSLIKESEKIDTDIAALERRLPAIEKELEGFRKNKIPRLFREFENNPSITSHPTLKVTFKKLKDYFSNHEQQYANMLIANKKAKSEFTKEFSRIYQQKLRAHQTFERTNKIITENVRQAQKEFERQFPDLDDKIRRLEEKYRDQKLELATDLRKKITPSRWRRSLTQQERALAKRVYQESKRRIENEEAAQLTPLKKQRSDYVQNYRKRIEQFREQFRKEKDLYDNFLNELEKENSLNTQEYQSDLSRNRSHFNNQVEADNRSFDSEIRNVRSALANHPDPNIRKYAESDGIVATIGRDKDTIDALTKEKEQIPLKLKELKEEREKYKFISMWWNEQGKQNEQVPTEAGVCVDCEETKENPLAEILRPNVPHLKLSCVEASIREKNAYNTGVMCSDSDNHVRSSKDICVTRRMADYTQWALNNAFDCLSTPDTTIDPQTIFRKLNNESTFKFFYSYRGGHGLMQTVDIAQNEILGIDSGGRPEGRKHLARVMNQNKESCQDYKSIIDFEKEAQLDQAARSRNTSTLNKLKAEYPQHNRRLFDRFKPCNFASLQDGIHRSILNGLGLFVYYKNEAKDDLLNRFFKGSNIAKNPQFKQIRDTLSLVYYGPLGRFGGKSLFEKKVLNEVKARFKDLSKMPAEEFEKLIAKHVKYIRAVQRSEGAVNASNDEGELQCIE